MVVDCPLGASTPSYERGLLRSHAGTFAPDGAIASDHREAVKDGSRGSRSAPPEIKTGKLTPMGSKNHAAETRCLSS